MPHEKASQRLDRQPSVTEEQFNCRPTIPKENERILVVSGNNRRLQVPSIVWLLEKEMHYQATL